MIAEGFLTPLRAQIDANTLSPAKGVELIAEEIYRIHRVLVVGDPRREFSLTDEDLETKSVQDHADEYLRALRNLSSNLKELSRMEPARAQEIELEPLPSIDLEAEETAERSPTPIVWLGDVKDMWHLWDLLDNKRLVRGTRVNWGRHFRTSEGTEFPGNGSTNIQRSPTADPALVKIVEEVSRNNPTK